MRKGLVINEDIWPLIDDLLPYEKSSLLTALSAYYKGDELPDTERIVKMVFNRIALDNARFDPENRKRLSEIRAEAGRKGGSKRKQTQANEANESKKSNLPQEENREDKNKSDKRVVFVPPTVDEVRAYVNEKGYAINPEAFVDFYTSKGWMIGSNKMKDWRACVRTWVRKDKTRGRSDRQEQKESKYSSLDFSRLLNKTGSEEW